MSAHESFKQAFNHMTMDMRGKLGGYQLSLEHRYGDPAVYAAQREEMAAQQAVVAYAQVKNREDALSVAYGKNRDRSREAHKARLQRYSQDKRPRYLQADSPPSPDPTSAPPPPGDPPPPKAPAARRWANAR